MYEEDLTNLDDWLRRLRVEYGVFFNGHRRKPPDDLKLRVEKLIKRLSEAQNMTYTERFQYNTLITRFYVLRDLWRRTLMSREQSDETRAEPPPAPGPPRPASSVLRISISDPAAEENKVRQLYEALLKMKGKTAATEASLPYHQFAGYIAKQTRSIKERYLCPSVLFTVVLEEDALRFTARAEKPSQEAARRTAHT